MPFGRTVTDLLTDFIPNDPVQPLVISDALRALPPNPIRGEQASGIVHEFIPNDPVAPIGLGQYVYDFFQDTGPGLGDGGTLNSDWWVV